MNYSNEEFIKIIEMKTVIYGKNILKNTRFRGEK